MKASALALTALVTVAPALVVPCSSRAAITHNRLASNRLASNRLASNRLAGNRLASNRLATNGLQADLSTSADLLSTADGREVYSYMISCALPGGTAIEADVPGVPDSSPESDPATPYTCSAGHCTFDGAMGLAPKWIDRKLSRKGQHWISACLFARCNAYDLAEAISLHGNHDSLIPSELEKEFFVLEEGAFYGNVFVDEGEPIQWYACMGRDQESTEEAGLAIRDCTEPDPDNPGFTRCGFIYAGTCRDSSPEFPSPFACSKYDDDLWAYLKCYEQSGQGTWPHIRKHKQVITSYVSN